MFPIKVNFFSPARALMQSSPSLKTIGQPILELQTKSLTTFISILFGVFKKLVPKGVARACLK